MLTVRDLLGRITCSDLINVGVVRINYFSLVFSASLSLVIMASNNPFEESPDTTPPAVHHQQAVKEPDKPSKSLEEVAEVLLREKLVLTALELNTELLENGKEISKLRDYFSNPGNFEHVMPQIAATIKSDIGMYNP